MKNPWGADYDFMLSFELHGINLVKWYDIPHPPPPMEIEISIAVPNYNRECYLEYLFKSIRAQSFPKEHYEIIVVDDASNDSSLELLEEICNEHSDYNIMVIPLDHTRTYNPGHPWNVAMRYCHGGIFMLFQADLLMLDRHVLEAMWRYHHKYSNLFLMPFCVEIHSKEKLELARPSIEAGKFEEIVSFCDTFRGADAETMQRFGTAFPNPNGMSIRLEHLLKLHGFDERIRTEPCEIDLFRRLTCTGIVYGLDDDSRTAHMYHRGGFKRENSPGTIEGYKWEPENYVRNGENWGLITEEEEQHNIFVTDAMQKWM